MERSEICHMMAEIDYRLNNYIPGRSSPDMRQHNTEELSAAENQSVHEKHVIYYKHLTRQTRENGIKDVFGTCPTLEFATPYTRACGNKIGERLDFGQGRDLALHALEGLFGTSYHVPDYVVK